MRNFYILMLSLCYLNLFGQSIDKFTLSSLGGFDKTSSAQLDWTIGQFASGDLRTSTTQLNQGFHQSYLDPSPVFDWATQDLLVEVWPNPTSDYINISYDGNEKYYVEVRDLHGRILLEKTAYHPNHSLDIAGLPAQALLLTIHNEKIRRGFKIVKTN